eukprot:scaffold3036_cov414-Prasinococcus_capsulatus_cf.AAC.6
MAAGQVVFDPINGELPKPKVRDPTLVNPTADAPKKGWESIATRDVKVAEAAGGRWNKFKTYSVLQRSFEIWKFVFTCVLRWWLMNQKWTYDKKQFPDGMTPENKAVKRREFAIWIKEGLLRLGPTFIKIGQQFSTRVDVLEKEYIEQLTELQDKVPPFSSKTARDIIERELGKPVEEIFEEFSDEPLAAASLGQVHLAKLNGQTVAVKVQRPGLKELFDIDLKNIRVLAINFDKLDPKRDGAARDWVAIYDECCNVLYREIDYVQEGQNADRFRENFAASGIDWIKVPKIYWETSNSQVLTMEYCPGIKISQVDRMDELSVDRKILARYAVESYLQQILKHGFFHADPHPGNLAVSEDGRLIFYDFGMMGQIPSNVREGLIEVFYGVYQKNAQRVLDALVVMGVLVPGKDQVSVLRTANFFLNQFQDRLKAQREERNKDSRDFRARGFKEQRTKEEGKQVRKARLAAIGEDLLSISADQPFRFPATFTFVVRAFSVLDGIGKGLDPRFDISEIARPYAMELLDLKPSTGIELAQKDFKERWNRQTVAVKNLFKGPNDIAAMAATIKRLQDGELKLRVRNLEAERQFQRVAAVQDLTLKAIGFAAMLNVATMLKVSATAAVSQWVATGAMVIAGVLGLLTLAGALKVKLLDKKELKYKGL